MFYKPKIIVIVGPTASGKSDLAIRLARSLHGEVISADSRQVYRGLNIGTGKISKNEMLGIRHHMLDVATPKSVYDIARYVQDAKIVISDVIARGKIPIICGGSGFYVSALVDGLILPDVSPNDALRASLGLLDVRELYRRLESLDPIYAKKIDQRNPRRLIRAIEIVSILGKMPALEKNDLYDALFIGITTEPEELHTLIRKRLLARVRRGMIAEVRRLHQRGVTWRRMEELGLEYRYVSRHLRGQLSKEEMLSQLESEIRQYAKRQLTWFKRDKRIHWIEKTDIHRARSIAKEFFKRSCRS